MHRAVQRIAQLLQPWRTCMAMVDRSLGVAPGDFWTKGWHKKTIGLSNPSCTTLYMAFREFMGRNHCHHMHDTTRKYKRLTSRLEGGASARSRRSRLHCGGPSAPHLMHNLDTPPPLDAQRRSQAAGRRTRTGPAVPAPAAALLPTVRSPHRLDGTVGACRRRCICTGYS